MVNTTTSKSESKIIRRKIQVVGGNTITVSLPRSWAKKHRLGRDQNEEQEILMRHHPDGSLIISPANVGQTHVERERRHEIRGKFDIEKLKRVLLADFIGGIDTIKLNFSKPLDVNVYHDIQTFVDRRLIGFDIIDMGKSLHVINMTQAPQFDVHKLMEIIRVQSTKMLEKSIKWIIDHTEDLEMLNVQIKEWEVTLDRKANQMLRTLQLAILDFWLAERVNLPMSEILYWSIVTISAESSADLSVAIAALAKIISEDTHHEKIKEDLYEFSKKSTDFYSRAMLAFIQGDADEAHKVLQDHGKTSVTIQKKWPIEFVEGISTNVTLVIRHVEKIGSYARKIAEATIDCEAAKIAYANN